MMILIWVGTIITSYIIETLTRFKNLEKIADKGYKIENFRIFNNNISILIPFFNLFSTLKNFSKNKEIENLSIKQLNDNFIPLSNKEKSIYAKNKNVITAFKINLKPQVDPNMILIFKIQDQENIIYFTIENNRYIICSIKGPLSKLSKKIQYKILEEQMNDINYIPKKAYKKKEYINQKENKIRTKISEYKILKESLIEENKNEQQKTYKKVA